MATDLQAVALAANELMASTRSFLVTQIPVEAIKLAVVGLWNSSWDERGREELRRAWADHLARVIQEAGVDEHSRELPIEDHAELVVRSFFVFHITRFMAERGIIPPDCYEEARSGLNVTLSTERADTRGLTP